jgi:ribonuclease P/MRP protein subunit RPP1
MIEEMTEMQSSSTKFNGFADLCLMSSDLIDDAIEMGFARVGVLLKVDEFESMEFESMRSASANVNFGILIETDTVSEMHKILRMLRPTIMRSKGLVAVKGTNPKVSRAALESRGVDILIEPKMNHVLARTAKKNSVAVALTSTTLLRTKGLHRAEVISDYRMCIKLWRKFGFPLLLGSGATNVYELRTPQEFESIGSLLSLDRHEVREILSETPKKVIQKASIGISGVELVPKNRG